MTNRWALVALCQTGFARRWGSRLSWLAAAFVVAGGAVLATFEYPADPTERFAGLLLLQLRGLLWLAAGPLAWSIAAFGAALQRREGIEALAKIRGYSYAQLAVGRRVAAMWSVALRLSVFSAIAGVLACASNWRGWAAGLLGCGALLGYALLAGALLGGIAALCADYGRRYGRWLFLAVMFIPWVLADVASQPALSLPGALDGLLVALVDWSWLPGAGS